MRVALLVAGLFLCLGLLLATLYLPGFSECRAVGGWFDCLRISFGGRSG